MYLQADNLFYLNLMTGGRYICGMTVPFCLRTRSTPRHDCTFWVRNHVLIAVGLRWRKQFENIFSSKHFNLTIFLTAWTADLFRSLCVFVVVDVCLLFFELKNQGWRTPKKITYVSMYLLAAQPNAALLPNSSERSRLTAEKNNWPVNERAGLVVF
jgi:hypothetical protein